MLLIFIFRAIILNFSSTEKFRLVSQIRYYFIYVKSVCKRKHETFCQFVSVLWYPPTHSLPLSAHSPPVPCSLGYPNEQSFWRSKNFLFLNFRSYELYIILHIYWRRKLYKYTYMHINDCKHTYCINNCNTRRNFSFAARALDIPQRSSCVSNQVQRFSSKAAKLRPARVSYVSTCFLRFLSVSSTRKQICWNVYLCLVATMLFTTHICGRVGDFS